MTWCRVICMSTAFSYTKSYEKPWFRDHNDPSPRLFFIVLLGYFQYQIILPGTSWTPK